MVAAFAPSTPYRSAGALSPVTTSPPKRHRHAAAQIEAIHSTARLLGIRDVSVLNLNPLLTALAEQTPPAPALFPNENSWLVSSVFSAWSQLIHQMIWQGIDDHGQGRYPLLIETLYASANTNTAASFAFELIGLNQPKPASLKALATYSARGAWTKPRAAGVIQLLLLSPDYLAKTFAS